MTARTSLAKELKRLASDRGISIDLLVEQARDTDRTGYAASTLREMLHEKRSLQIRALVAFGRALDIDLSDHEEYRLRMVRHLTDESVHGLKQALANLQNLEVGRLPQLSDEQVRQIPISHRRTRRESVSRGSALARPTRRRTEG